MTKEEIIGRCIGEASITELTFISKNMPHVGEYVIFENEGAKILGMVENLARGSVAISDAIYDPKTVEKIKSIEGDDYYIKGKIRVLGDVERRDIPRVPPAPGTKIVKADKKTLEKIFGKNQNGLKLGSLISQREVPVYVDINKMVTRHLAILAMTGAGKSNTVAVIVDGLLEQKGCVVVIDMHSEYVNAKFKNGKVHKIEPKINPLYFSISDLGGLAKISGSAHVQERYYRKAYKAAQEKLRNGEIKSNQLLDNIVKNLEGFESIKGIKKESLNEAINKIEDLQNNYGKLVDYTTPKIIDQLKLGCANVIDLGTVDEKTADIIVSNLFRTILKSRKNFVKNGEGMAFPVFIVIEEAHILAPKDRGTKSKFWIGRIAREGRKFGTGLCLVSQSPKSVDSGTLSQANNMIILRLVEPQDQRYVQAASESLSEDLLSQLPSLNIGEAVVVGLMSKIPAIVKIDKFQGKLIGGDLDIVDLWNSKYKNDKDELKRLKEEAEDFEGDY